MGMPDDVSGLFTKLVTVDGVASFGSPLTPVLSSLVHRPMFDGIYELCRRRGLRLSIWVDDLTISGNFVPGCLLADIRDVIRKHGLKSHKLTYWTGNRLVPVTGLMISGEHIMASRGSHEKIRALYADLAGAGDDIESEKIIDKLLSALGTAFRYIVGRVSTTGKKTSDRMNSLRQKRRKLAVLKEPPMVSQSASAFEDEESASWE